MSEILPALRERRARRAFDTRPVPADIERLLWEATAVAPSHGNTQPIRIVVARSAEAREGVIGALSEGNRTWAPAAPLLFAIAANPEHSPNQKNSDGTFRELWAFNAGIATGNLLAQATSMGLVAHPMAGFDEPAVRAVFGIPPEVRVLVLVAAGYPGPVDRLPEDLREKETAPQERISIGNMVGDDAWGEALAPSARELRKRQG